VCLLNALAPVLLTGATGLIGGELLRAMLSRGLRNVTAVVRPACGRTVEMRITDRLRRSGCEWTAANTRLRAVAGDVRWPGLGLQSAVADRLRAEVEIIVHTASETSFIRTRDCRDTNIGGMRHLLDFAAGCARRPLIVYMSTAADSGAVVHCCLREEDGCRPDRPHHNEYTHTKALAERMLWDSGLPALVLRPSIVLSAGLPDAAFARAILWFVPLLNEFNAMPIDPASRLDIVPVSFVVGSTLALLELPQRRYDCYHLSAGSRGAGTCGEVGAFLNVYYARQTPLRLVPPPQWTREMHRRFVGTSERRKMFAMLKHYLPFLNMDVTYDNARLATDLGERAARVPPFTSYLGELLGMITHEMALDEAHRP
jgi:nucleoside-diphosphate-sugar epimerase